MIFFWPIWCYVCPFYSFLGIFSLLKMNLCQSIILLALGLLIMRSIQTCVYLVFTDDNFMKFDIGASCDLYKMYRSFLRIFGWRCKAWVWNIGVVFGKEFKFHEIGLQTQCYFLVLFIFLPVLDLKTFSFIILAPIPRHAMPVFFTMILSTANQYNCKF